MHIVRRVAGQRPGTFGVSAGPARRVCALQRPGAAPAGQFELAELSLAGRFQLLTEVLVALGQQGRHTLAQHRPDNRHSASLRTIDRQESQNFTLAEPLECSLLVRPFALQSSRNRGLRVGCYVEINAELGARAARSAFADDRQCRLWRAGQHFDQRLKSHSLGQSGLQGGHVDNPGQARHLELGRRKVDFTASVTLDLHGQHFGGVLRVGPATQRLQQRARLGIQGVGSHVAIQARIAFRQVLGLLHQADPQAFARQQQGQRAPHNAAAADANIKGLTHGRDCRRRPDFRQMSGLRGPGTCLVDSRNRQVERHLIKRLICDARVKVGVSARPFAK